MKAKLTIFFLSLFGIIAPVKGLIILTTFAVMADSIFAIYYVCKKKGRKYLQSGKMFNAITKTIIYVAAILIMYGLDTLIFGGALLGVKLLLTKGVALVETYIELKSVDETSQKLGNKPFLNQFSDMIKKFGKIKKDLSQE
jgi:hypothetical protein